MMVDRYTPVFDEDEQGADTEADPEGDYVSYQDYSDLEKELEDVKQKFRDIQDLIENAAWEAVRVRL